MPSGPKLGLVWLLGSVVVAIVAMLLPRAWFSDTPRPARPVPSADPVMAADAAGEPDVPR